MLDQLLGEPTLADAWLADQQEEPPAAGERIIETAVELDEFPLAAHEPAGRRLGRRLGRHRPQVKCRILLQDRLV